MKCEIQVVPFNVLLIIIVLIKKTQKKLEDEMRCFLYKVLLDVEPAGIIVIRSSNHLCD